MKESMPSKARMKSLSDKLSIFMSFTFFIFSYLYFSNQDSTFFFVLYSIFILCYVGIGGYVSLELLFYHKKNLDRKKFLYRSAVSESELDTLVCIHYIILFMALSIPLYMEAAIIYYWISMFIFFDTIFLFVWGKRLVSRNEAP